jgi:hypothetical protein
MRRALAAAPAAAGAERRRALLNEHGYRPLVKVVKGRE